MALPVTIPNEFANATASIPLSQLDTNFNTLANAVNGISDGSESLANVSVTGGTISNVAVSATTLNTSGAVVFNDAGADVDFRVEGDTNANLLFVDASTDRVGIGTSSPATTNHVKSSGVSGLTLERSVIGAGASTTLQPIRFGGPNSTSADANHEYAQIRAQTTTVTSGSEDGVLIFSTSNSGSLSEAMRIDSSGNVGIGTDSPAAKVHILGLNQNFLTSRNSVPPSSAAGLGGYQFGGYSTGTTTVAAASIAGLAGGAWTSISTPSQMLFYTTPSGTTTASERMRIDDSGNVMIGTTSSANKLLVNDNTNRTEATAQFRIWGSGYSIHQWLDATAAYIGQDSGSRALRLYSSAETAGVNLAAGGTSWGTFSDERLKYDVEPITDGLTKLANVRCVSYRLKDVDAEDSQKKLGVIAQDLVGIVDEVIDTTKRSGDDTEYMSVRYTELIPVLTKAIQELKAELDTVKAELATLKG